MDGHPKSSFAHHNKQSLKISLTVPVKVYSQFLETIPDAAILVRENGSIACVNHAAEKMFGYAENELTDQPLDVLIPSDLRQKHSVHVQNFVGAPKTRAMGSGMPLLGLCKDNVTFPVDIMLTPLLIERENYVLSIVRDITKMKRYEDELKKAAEREAVLARTDYLTGIANSRHFYQIVQTEMERLRRYNTPFTLVYIDLDQFKAVNDFQGHAEGDKVLCTVAHFLANSIRKTDCVARLGGDEFVLLLLETSPQAAQASISKIQNSLKMEMQKHHWPVTFSIGVLTCVEVPSSVEELIKMADSLMYTVKNAGKDAIRCAVYTGSTAES